MESWRKSAVELANEPTAKQEINKRVEYNALKDKEAKAWQKLKDYEAKGYDMSMHYDKFKTIGADENPVQRAWNGVRKFTSEGATTFGEIFNQDTSQYRDNVNEIELRENNWKQHEADTKPHLYKSPDEVWNVAGGAGEVTPYVAGGIGMGASKAPTIARKLAGDVARGATADTILATAQYGHKDEWDKEVAKEVGLGIAGQTVGTTLAHLLNKVGADKLVKQLIKEESVEVPLKNKSDEKIASQLNKEYFAAGGENQAGDIIDEKLTPNIPKALPTDKKELQQLVVDAVKNDNIEEFLTRLPDTADVDKARSYMNSLKPNFEMVGQPKDVTVNKTVIDMPPETRDTAGINDKPIIAYLDVLRDKHPEIFKDSKSVFKHIMNVKNNPTHFSNGNKPTNKILSNINMGKLNSIGVNMSNDDYNLLVHAMRKSRPRELFDLVRKQLEGSTLDSSNPSFLLGRGGSAETSPSMMDYKSGSTVSSDSIIPKANDLSQDVSLHSSATVSGGAIGGLTGATNDLDQDGEITSKDILLGFGLGAAGTKSAMLLKDSKAAQKAIDGLKKVADSDVVDAFTGHKLYGKKDYMNIREDMISSKNAKMESYVQLHEQLKLLSDDSKQAIHKYMTGENVELTPQLRTLADNYTRQIENQGKQLVDLGILDAAQYEKFRGRYLHRVYEKDLTKNVSSAFTKGKTIPGVHQRGREWTGSKTEYEKYIKDGMIGDFFQGKIEARKLQNGQYKFTQDWTKEQRAKWGEIEDIAYSLPETLMRMNDMLEHGKMLKSVVDKTNLVADEALDGYTQLQGKRFGSLQGKYVPKDVADDITEFNRALFGAEDGKIFSKEVVEAFKALSTFWKKSHTVYNPTAHLNNLMSNVTMQFMQGVNPITALNHAKDGALAHAKLGEFRRLTAKTLVGLTKEEENTLKALTLDDDLSLYIQAEKAGLFGRSKLNDILGQYVNPTTKKFLGKWTIPRSLRKIDEKTSAWYQGEDNIMRFSLLKSLTQRGKSFEEALKEVNNTIPDYTKPMSRMARFGRNSMLTPFISWTYYSTPIILRQFKEHPIRAVALMGSIYGINKMFGIDPYDKQDIPQQNFAMKRVPIYKNGKNVTTIKVDRWMPHNEILSPHDFVKNLTNGGAWKGGYEVLNNQNLYYGGKISYNEGQRKAYDITKYAVQQISPDAVDKVWNMAESAILSKKRRTKHPVIQPRTKTQEALNLLGLNTLTYDKKAQKKKAIKERLK